MFHSFSSGCSVEGLLFRGPWHKYATEEEWVDGAEQSLLLGPSKVQESQRGWSRRKAQETRGRKTKNWKGAWAWTFRYVSKFISSVNRTKKFEVTRAFWNISKVNNFIFMLPFWRLLYCPTEFFVTRSCSFPLRSRKYLILYFCSWFWIKDAFEPRWLFS